MMPLHRIRDLDAKCTEWVGRQPGRTVREKLAGKPSILGVRREFTAETNENILVAKLLRGLLPRVDERLRDHAWYIAYAPADKPTIAIAVVAENSGFGARAAAPIARQVLDYYLLGKVPNKPAPSEED